MVGYSSANRDPCKHREEGKFPGDRSRDHSEKGPLGALGAHLPLTFLLSVLLTAGTEEEQGEEPSNQDRYFILSSFGTQSPRDSGHLSSLS